MMLKSRAQSSMAAIFLSASFVAYAADPGDLFPEHDVPSFEGNKAMRQAASADAEKVGACRAVLDIQFDEVSGLPFYPDAKTKTVPVSSLAPKN